MIAAANGDKSRQMAAKKLMADKQNPIYKVLFNQQDKLIELYASEVSQSSLMAFVEVSDLIFDNKTAMLVDPSQEKLKAEFAGVSRTYIPMHQVVRIDEVAKKGVSKIRSIKNTAAITPFPFPTPPSK